jgi:hypothetical protein
MSVDLSKYWAEGSVMGLQPREAMTLRVSEGANGWLAVAYTGDGTKPGSLEAGAGGFKTPEAAFAWLLEASA